MDGNTVRSIRKQIGMNRTRFARKVGVSLHVLRRIELGAAVVPEDAALRIMQLWREHQQLAAPPSPSP